MRNLIGRNSYIRNSRLSMQENAYVDQIVPNVYSKQILVDIKALLVSDQMEDVK